MSLQRVIYITPYTVAPLIEPGSMTKPSFVEYWAVRTISTVLKTVVMNNPVDPKQLSRDPSVAKEYAEDPLVHTYGSFQLCNSFMISLQVTTIVLLGEDLLKEEYKTVTVPVLITHGTHDTQTSYVVFFDCLFNGRPEASKKFINLVPSKDKTYASYPNCLHERDSLVYFSQLLTA